MEYGPTYEQLKEQLRDEALAFNHANEMVGKYEADATRLEAENAKLRADNKALLDALQEISDSSNGDFPTDGEQIAEMRKIARAVLAEHSEPQ